ncbi:hypothetical protein J7412_21805, partial [Shimia sp. R9_3]|nr:hypothetical protein [Shimia sp. R9_3]
RLISAGGSVYIHDGEGANRLELVDVALAEVSFSQDDTFTRLTWEDATHGTTQAKIHRSTNFEEFVFADGSTVGLISFGSGGVRLSGTSGDDILTGSATGARILFGGEGDDVLTATYRGGTSDLFGQGGNDTYRLISAGGTVYINDGEGANRLELVDVALAEVSFSQDDTFTRLTWEDATHGITQAKIHRST